ncbi:major facilitator superfamily domain-containing protein [Aspergillus insuetus]
MAAEISTITAILEDAREDLAGPSQNPLHDEAKTNEESGDVLDHRDFKLSNSGRLIFFALAVLTLMVALDGTSISVALPIMATTLHGTAMQAFWSGTSFLLASTVFQPTTATFSSIFGRRPVLLVCITVFFVGSLVSGIANDFTQILIGRCVQGVGSGGIAVLAEVVVTDLVPLRLRGNYYDILSAMYSLGSVLGPILGGGFAGNVSWRWIFYINIPFIAIATILVLFFFRLERPLGSLRTKLSKIDYVGTPLFIGSMSSFLIPLTWGGVIIKASNPVIPHSAFKNRSAAIAFATSSLQGLILWGALYYLPLYYQAIHEFGLILTGVALFPQTFTVAPAAIICGVIITITGRYRWGLWFGWALSNLGLGLLCLLDTRTRTVQWIFLNLPCGLGLGLLTAAIVCTVQASATNQNLTVAVAMNRMRRELLRYPAWASRASELSRDAAALVTVIQGMEDSVEKTQLKSAYVDSLRVFWGFLAGVAGVGLCLSVLVKKYDLNRALVTEQGLRD